MAATGWAAPGSFGYKAAGCGTFCTFRPVEVRRLFEAAGGHSGAITIAYNADSSHAGWVRRTCASIRGVLGVTCRGKAIPTFAGFRTRVTKRTLTGMFRAGWQVDYPSIGTFLTPLYRSGAANNDNDYSNRRLDAKLAAAAARLDPAAANRLYQEAERMLRADMPAIPLWYFRAIGGYSTRVASIRFSPTGTYDLTSLRLK